MTRRPYSSFKVTAAFDPWNEIDGELISPVPNNAPPQQPGIRTWPPHAAWYTVTPNPSWTGQNQKPLLWDQSRKSLKLHKDLLMDACNHNGATDEQKKLIMSMAMLETEYMWGRDNSKDHEGDAMNVWCLNLNLDMLRQVGYTGNGNDLIAPDSLPKIVGYLLKWFTGQAELNGAAQKSPYVKSTLNFVRYGRKGYDSADTDHVIELNCRDYRSAILTVYKALENPPPAGHKKLWESDDRLGIDIPWI
ncbi:hypothetical protein WJX75_009903 [Coccomyxa subellipsoidea]|uniref:Uncharacterized protein n=1 Tax=Coccomyxa subellipsoidea TaxID=248742 RepID=A0ABR2YDE0_9CHLO